MHGPDAEPPAGPNLPLGVVTFLMTDVESSTRLWRESPEAAALIARQTELIAAAVARHGGVRDQGGGRRWAAGGRHAGRARHGAAQGVRPERARASTLSPRPAVDLFPAHARGHGRARPVADGARRASPRAGRGRGAARDRS